MPPMKVSQIGEFGLIKKLAYQSAQNIKKNTPSYRQLVTGIGDDAAVWNPTVPFQLATVDSLVENIHFTLKTITWEELGWKSLAVNLSDIAAMGGIPLYALISLGLPPETKVESITRLYAGMNKIARKFGVMLVGGDTVSSPFIFISVMVIGSAANKDGKTLSRSSAKPGDKVAVTGTIGASAGGLKMLLENLKFSRKDATTLRKAHLTPHPRVKEGLILVKNGVKCGMDISDGLVGDLTHICEMSRVGAKINIATVPLSPSLKTCFGEKALEMAISGGEDYELLFTAPQAVIEQAQKRMKCQVTIIGEITAVNSGKVLLMDHHGKKQNLKQTGWDHFNRQ
ncbi:MAG: thiamine-phosphate kinase [Dehalococcoidales bacterium]|nr:thiamine-phosphate kinase [Dehalococcoidales bacterium]